MSKSRARPFVRRLGLFALVLVVALAAVLFTSFSTISTAQAQEETTTTAGGSGGFGSSGWMLLVWVGGLGLVFYFLLIRPQRNRAKKQQELMASMSVGDEVQTIGGIYGTIEYFDKETDTAVLQVEGGGKLRVARRALADKVKPKGN